MIEAHEVLQLFCALQKTKDNEIRNSWWRVWKVIQRNCIWKLKRVPLSAGDPSGRTWECSWSLLNRNRLLDKPYLYILFLNVSGIVWYLLSKRLTASYVKVFLLRHSFCAFVGTQILFFVFELRRERSPVWFRETFQDLGNKWYRYHIVPNTTKILLFVVPGLRISFLWSSTCVLKSPNTFWIY